MGGHGGRYLSILIVNICQLNSKPRMKSKYIRNLEFSESGVFGKLDNKMDILKSPTRRASTDYCGLSFV